MERILKHLIIGSLTISTISLGNVVGNDTQNFNPAVTNTSFLTVQSSDVLQPGQFRLGLFMNHAVNTLPYPNTKIQGRGDWNDSITGTEVHIGAGIIKNLDFGLALPFIVNQNVESQTTHGEFEEMGNTDIRASLRYNFMKSNGFSSSVIGSANINRVEDNPHTGARTSPAYHIELISDYNAYPFIIGANLGYRFRSPGEKIEGSLIDPIDNQYLYSLAIRGQITGKFSLVSEFYGAQASNEVRNETNRSLNSAETTLGARYDSSKSTVWHTGVGSELVHGLSTPDWRFYAGVATILDTATKGKTIVKKKKRRKKRPVDTSMDFQAEEIPSDLIGQVPDEVFILEDIHFEFDSDYRILSGGIAELKKLAGHLEQTGYSRLLVEGHTDAYGTDAYNEDLSARRAKTVRRHLIKYLDLNSDQIYAVGFGEYNPISDNISDEGRQENRRVEVKIFRD